LEKVIQNQAKDENLTKLNGAHSRLGKCYPRLDLKLYPKKKLLTWINA
jgi:hypothetical protein